MRDMCSAVSATNTFVGNKKKSHLTLVLFLYIEGAELFKYCIYVVIMDHPLWGLNIQSFSITSPYL